MKPIRSRLHALVLAALPMAQVACYDAPAYEPTGSTTGTSTGTDTGSTGTCQATPTSTGSTGNGTTATGSTSGGGGCGTQSPYVLQFVTTNPAAGTDGGLDYAICQTLCPPQLPSVNESLSTCSATVDPACPGEWDVSCDYSQGCLGRRPEGFALAETLASDALEAFLQQSAQLESASVTAFDRLARELATHGAPAALVERARVAQADEVRHTASMQALLARPMSLQAAAPLPVRALFAMAVENAVEGCVREAYGAVQARWQAQQAAWPELRATMEAIAEEELSHAELAFELADWLSAQLSDPERACVALARSQEIAHLQAALSAEAPTALRSAVGLPSAAQALALHARLQSDLWA